MTLENLKRLQQSVPEGADALFITSGVHQYYLTGFHIEDGYVVVMRDRALVFVDFRYIEAARAALDADAFCIHMNTSLAFVCETLTAESVKTMAFEDRVVTVSALKTYKDVFADKITLVPMEGLLDSQRMKKTDYEIEMIKKAQQITDAAFAHILDFITPQRTETEVALELEFFMRKLGATSTSFPTICISGAATSLPHGEPQDRLLQPGFLTMDYGCVYHGYCSDMTRTVAIGAVTDEMKRVYDTVLAAQTAVLEAIDWHSDCAAMDKIARDIIDNAGYRGAFGHGLGHGVGLFIHERPSLNFRSGGILLEDGHVVTVEPGIYLEGKFGVRIEDMVVIRNHRAEDITNSPKNLIIL
ncbi:MAG: aminopeptidase P family protein [Clostridia bacterium]|nr:aminopeptidase P family protein [Clostridia bacterium]